METCSASAFSDARDSSALLTASCKLSLDCARHGVDTVSTNNNNDANMPNSSPETLTDVFTAPFSLGAQIIEHGCPRAPISADCDSSEASVSAYHSPSLEKPRTSSRQKARCQQMTAPRPPSSAATVKGDRRRLASSGG